MCPLLGQSRRGWTGEKAAREGCLRASLQPYLSWVRGGLKAGDESCGVHTGDPQCGGCVSRGIRGRALREQGRVLR